VKINSQYDKCGKKYNQVVILWVSLWDTIFNTGLPSNIWLRSSGIPWWL